jgi:hypothetical protein
LEPKEISGNLKTPDIGLLGQPEKEKIWDISHNSPVFPEVSLVSIQAIQEYLALLWHQYQDASRPVKSKILDEIEKNVKMHRKAAIRLMNKPEEPIFARGKGKSVNSYSDKSKALLKAFWEEQGRLGGVRTKASIPIWIDKWDKADMDDLTRFELLSMSESTVERTLKKPKAEFRRRQNTGTKPGTSKVKTLIPIRDLEFEPQEPGHCEIDCVAHCGGSLSGEFIWTLTLTDIKTGITECEALQFKNGFEVQLALHRIEERLPFKIIALYMDNGSEFLNQDVYKRFSLKKMQIDRKDIIKLFRSRPYKKNDQCFVEQKNYTHVRELFGYDRFSGKLMVQLMNNIYRNEWSTLTNFFYPQIRLKSKERIGSKVKRKFHEPKTPFELLKGFLSEEDLKQLEAKAEESNPFTLRKKLKKKLREFSAYNSRSAERLGKYAV